MELSCFLPIIFLNNIHKQRGKIKMTLFCYNIGDAIEITEPIETNTDYIIPKGIKGKIKTLKLLKDVDLVVYRIEVDDLQVTKEEAEIIEDTYFVDDDFYNSTTDSILKNIYINDLGEIIIEKGK